jgi:hypothetical protein
MQPGKRKNRKSCPTRNLSQYRPHLIENITLFSVNLDGPGFPGTDLEGDFMDWREDFSSHRPIFLFLHISSQPEDEKRKVWFVRAAFRVRGNQPCSTQEENLP